MKLRPTLDTLEGVDDAIAGYYAERSIAGKNVFVLQLENFDSHPDVRGLKTAHESRRTKIVELEGKVADLEARVDGLPEDFDSAAFEELKRRAEAGKGAPDPAEIERQVNDRVAKQTKKITDERDAAKALADKAIAQRNARERELALNEALTKAGVTDPTYLKAARAMLSTGIEVVEADDGSVAVVYNDRDLDIRVPVTDHIKAWAEGDEGKAFVGARQNAGGGAGGDGGQGGGSGGGKNPYKPGEHFNMTEQTRLERENPVLAKRLAREAGVTLD